MKKAVFVVLALICCSGAFAQNDTYRYHFNGNLNEMYSKAPAMTAQCTGTYGTEILLAGLSKKTYRFNHGCGLVYNDAIKNFIASGAYTIEMYFRLDTISGYKKLVDFDSLKQDAGLYNQSGKIVLYPNPASADSFVGAGVYSYVAMTRNATTKKVYVSANGKTVGTYADNTDQYKLGVDKLLMFFRDDKTTNGEQSKGAVAMIQISNYAIDSNTIKSNYTNLGKTLDVPGTVHNNQLVIYPNPATNNIHIISVTDCNYCISDITGKTIKTGFLRQGDNSISLDPLSSGLYLLKMVGSGDVAHEVYKITRQ